MKKMVNGEIVDMTPAEIAQRQVEEAAFEALRIVKANAPPPRDLQAELDALKARLDAVERAR